VVPFYFSATPSKWSPFAFPYTNPDFLAFSARFLCLGKAMTVACGAFAILPFLHISPPSADLHRWVLYQKVKLEAAVKAFFD